MYGGGRGGFGYSSPMDTDPTRPGTQLNPYDQNPNVPGVQNYGGQGGFGQGGYGGVGYASKRDTDPFTPGTQTNPYDQNPNVPGVQSYGTGGYGQGGYGQGGYGQGGVGYASKRDTDPFTPGTQTNPYDQNPHVPGVQNYGTGGGFGGGYGGGRGYWSFISLFRINCFGYVSQKL